MTRVAASSTDRPELNRCPRRLPADCVSTPQSGRSWPRSVSTYPRCRGKCRPRHRHGARTGRRSARDRSRAGAIVLHLERRGDGLRCEASPESRSSNIMIGKQMAAVLLGVTIALATTSATYGCTTFTRHDASGNIEHCTTCINMKPRSAVGGGLECRDSSGRVTHRSIYDR